VAVILIVEDEASVAELIAETLIQRGHEARAIIMLTANTDDELARATFRRGAFDYISKPFNIDHLVQVVEIALAS
jgi:two-component system, NtrC family, nitrogen regulation response regulator GlnG